jgi:hypothetical protein
VTKITGAMHGCGKETVVFSLALPAVSAGNAVGYWFSLEFRPSTEFTHNLFGIRGYECIKTRSRLLCASA